MAAPIENVRNVRIRVILPQISASSQFYTGSSWLFVDIGTIKTIHDLCNYLCTRFSLNYSIKLTLDGSDLQEWDDCRLLRDGDTIRHVK